MSKNSNINHDELIFLAEKIESTSNFRYQTARKDFTATDIGALDLDCWALVREASREILKMTGTHEELREQGLKDEEALGTDPAQKDDSGAGG